MMATTLVSQINTKLSSQRLRRSKVRISVTDLTRMEDTVSDHISFVGWKLNKEILDSTEITHSIDRDYTAGDIESSKRTNNNRVTKEPRSAC